VPFKANAARRHHIPKQRHRVTNWRAYDASLRQRGSLTIWFTEGPWCTDQWDGRLDPTSRRGSCDADGLRATELEHAVQGTNGDGDLGGLTTVGA
jgi:hypothetical protein